MEKAMSLAPDDPTVLVQRGRVLELEGDKQGAWESVRAAIEAGSSDTDAAAVAAGVAPAIGNTEEVIELLNERPKNVEFILTGRRAPEAFLEMADLVSDVKEVKHYYNRGVKARTGIER